MCVIIEEVTSFFAHGGEESQVIFLMIARANKFSCQIRCLRRENNLRMIWLSAISTHG
jgi:hypothetical protein